MAPNDSSGKETAAAPRAAEEREDVLISALKGLTEQMQNSNTTPQIAPHKYVPQTGTNPKGLPEDKRPRLTRKYHENGGWMFEDRLSDEERLLLEKIKPGVYNNGKWTVTQVMRGGIANINIGYSNKSMEQRMDLKNDARNLVEMLTKIIDEASTQKLVTA
jgi:hypothetical protein